MDALNPPTRLALAALAVWRVTHLLSAEDGPGDVIFHLRARVGAGFLGKLMDCFYCLSLWIAAPAALVVTRDASAWGLVWLALSGAACLLERASEGRSGVSETAIEGELDHGLLWKPPGEPEDRQPPAGRAAEAAGRG